MRGQGTLKSEFKYSLDGTWGEHPQSTLTPPWKTILVVVSRKTHKTHAPKGLTRVSICFYLGVCFVRVSFSRLETRRTRKPFFPWGGWGGFPLLQEGDRLVVRLHEFQGNAKAAAKDGNSGTFLGADGYLVISHRPGELVWFLLVCHIV